MLMLDLCSGLKGASAAMVERGWQVISVDINPAFEPDIIADVRQWSYRGPPPDLVWASPPCNEFSREFLPWHRTGKAPDMSIAMACIRIIQEARPRYWCLESTRGGAIFLAPILGRPREIHSPYYLWGIFPPLGLRKLTYRHKESYPSSAEALRAKIPYELSLAMAEAVSRYKPLIP